MVLSDNGMESYVFPVADLNGAAKPEQSKTVNITANGTQTVTPDSGKVLSSVVINTNVPAPTVETQEKSVEITANGDSEVTPDTGKYLSKVNISVNVPTSSESKLPQVVDGTVTVLTAADLAGATKIRNSGFMDCDGLISIQIPSTVTSIGESAFQSCNNLSSIELGYAVESIGNYAFHTCISLQNITIPSSVTSIGKSAFYGASNFESITMLSQTPPTLGTGAFFETKINQIIVPAGCGDAYKAATNWANYADYIVEATA